MGVGSLACSSCLPMSESSTVSSARQEGGLATEGGDELAPEGSELGVVTLLREVSEEGGDSAGGGDTAPVESPVSGLAGLGGGLRATAFGLAGVGGLDGRDGGKGFDGFAIVTTGAPATAGLVVEATATSTPNSFAFEAAKQKI